MGDVLSSESRRCRDLVHELLDVASGLPTVDGPVDLVAVLGAADAERRERLLREIGSDADWVRDELGKDVYRVIRAVQDALPDVCWEQLAVSHDADDDGLWFFSLPGIKQTVQVESSTGQAPFVVEGDGLGHVSECASVGDAAGQVADWLEAYAWEQGRG